MENVENNPLRTVEFSGFPLFNGKRAGSFPRFQRSFQHVEKKGPFYKVYMDSNVENFCRKKSTDKMTRELLSAGRDKIQAGKKGNPMAKAGRLCYTLL